MNTEKMQKLIKAVVKGTRGSIEKTAKTIAKKIDQAGGQGDMEFECENDGRRIGQAIGTVLSICLAAELDECGLPMFGILDGVKDVLDGVELVCPVCECEGFDPGTGECEECGFNLFD